MRMAHKSRRNSSSNILRHTLKEPGKILIRYDFVRTGHGHPFCKATVVRKFGSWSNALKEAGLEPTDCISLNG